MKIVSGTLSLLVGFWIFSSFMRASASLDPNSPEAREFSQKINDRVAEDAVKQLSLSMKGGDLPEICVQAGLVVAAYNQAHDEKNYLNYKKLQRTACKKAGMSID